MQRKCNYFALLELTDESLYGFSVGLSSRAVVAPVLILWALAVWKKFNQNCGKSIGLIRTYKLP